MAVRVNVLIEWQNKTAGVQVNALDRLLLEAVKLIPGWERGEDNWGDEIFDLEANLYVWLWGEKKRRVLQNRSRGDWLYTPVVLLYFQSPEPHPAGRSGGRSPERCRWSGREPHPRRSTVCSTQTNVFAGPLAGRDAVEIHTSECGNIECNMKVKVKWCGGRGGGGATLLL